MTPRKRLAENDDLKPYEGLGRYKDGRYFFLNKVTGKQVSLRTRDFAKAKSMWIVASASVKQVYGDKVAESLAASITQSHVPKSKGANIHLCDFMKDFREDILEKKKLKIKISRNKGKLASPRTHADYTKYSEQLEAHPDAKFPLSSPVLITKTRVLLAHWLETPTHYNHLKAYLGRVYDHAVKSGLIESSPMIHVEKEAVPERQVLIPDEAYVAITDAMLKHRHNRKVYDGEWMTKIADLVYMMSQQPVDAFSLKVSQIDLEASDHGEIPLSRSKTGVAGVIVMNLEMREVIDWLLAFRKREMDKVTVVEAKHAEYLMLLPAYFEPRFRLRRVTPRTFSKWWLAARKTAGIEEDYWLMDLRKKGLTEEYVAQGENDKGLHESQRMKDHYRLIKPPKRSHNTLVSIRGKK